MNVPLIALVPWGALIAFLAFCLVVKSYRVGRLEAQLEDARETIALLRSPLLGAPTSMVMPFRNASYADVFGNAWGRGPKPWPGWPGTGIGDMSVLPSVAKCPRCGAELGDTPLGEHLLGEECQRRTGDTMPPEPKR